MAQKPKKTLFYPEETDKTTVMAMTEAAKVPSNIKQTPVTAEKGTASYPMAPPKIGLEGNPYLPGEAPKTTTVDSSAVEPVNPYQEMLGVRTADWFNMDNLDGYMKNAAERYKKSVEGRSAGLVADAEYGKNDILDSHNEAYRALRAQNRENINALPGQMTRLGLYGSGTGEVALSNIQTDFQNQYNELIKQKNKGIMDIDNQIRQIRRDAATKIDDYYAQLASQYPQYYMQMLQNKVNAINADRSYLTQDKQHNDNMAYNWANATAQNNQWYAGFEREGKWREEDVATRKQEIADAYAREDELYKRQKMDALVQDYMQKNPYALYAIQNGTMDMPDFNKMYEMMYGEPYDVSSSSTENTSVNSASPTVNAPKITTNDVAPVTDTAVVENPATEAPVAETVVTVNPYQSLFQQYPVNSYYGSTDNGFIPIGGEKQKAVSRNPFAPLIYDPSIKVKPQKPKPASSVSKTTTETTQVTPSTMNNPTALNSVIKETNNRLGGTYVSTERGGVHAPSNTHEMVIDVLLNGDYSTENMEYILDKFGISESKVNSALKGMHGSAR